MNIQPMEKSPLLATVQGIVGGVQVQDYPLGRTIMGLDEKVPEQGVHRRGVGTDAPVAVGGRLFRTGELQAGKGRRGRQGPAPIAQTAPVDAGQVGLAHKQGQQGIGAQGVVVVEVLVAQCQGEDALGDKVGDTVLDGGGVAVVGKAAGQALEQSQAGVYLAQQQAAGVGSEVPAVESGRYLAPAQA